MKKIIKIIVKLLLYILVILIVILIISSTTNVFFNKADRKKLKAYGKKVEVDGRFMNTYIEGSGDTTIVLLPGFGTSSPILDFTPLTKQLSKRYRVVVIEPFGYGLSDPASKPRTIENITSELHECLQALNINKYILMPHSLSGIYSLYYTNQYPEEVSGVIGIDTSVPNQYNYQSMGSGYVGEKLLDNLGLVRIIAKIVPDLVFPSDVAPEYTNGIINQIKKMSILNFANNEDEKKHMKDNFEKTIGLEYPSDLPVLFFLSKSTIAANESWWLQEHEKQIESLQNAEIIELDGSHYLHRTCSELMENEITRFIE